VKLALQGRWYHLAGYEAAYYIEKKSAEVQFLGLESTLSIPLLQSDHFLLITGMYS
jgi:hypothetical protein